MPNNINSKFNIFLVVLVSASLSACSKQVHRKRSPATPFGKTDTSSSQSNPSNEDAIASKSPEKKQPTIETNTQEILADEDENNNIVESEITEASYDMTVNNISLLEGDSGKFYFQVTKVAESDLSFSWKVAEDGGGQ